VSVTTRAAPLDDDGEPATTRRAVSKLKRLLATPFSLEPGPPLGIGSYGKVKRGVDARDNSPVAVKVRGDDDDAVARR